MFKNLLSFWKGKDFLSQVLGEFSEMLSDTEEMFLSVRRKLFEGTEEPGLKDKIYEIDQGVNRLEKDIRKRIIAHLSVQAGVDVPACLVLMSVVKDAERLGDYAKNLFEVTEMIEEPLDKELFTELFGDLDTKILETFKKTKQAFLESDEQVAKEILNLEGDILRRCDASIAKLAKSKLVTNTAVCLTLIARYFKRTVAHLTNISSSVILPISDLDFYDEKFRHGNTK
jgi:phosphate uptake regulator